MLNEPDFTLIKKERILHKISTFSVPETITEPMAISLGFAKHLFDNNSAIFVDARDVEDYEGGLIPKIKWFLHPRKSEYRFRINDIVKYIYFEMSFHQHIEEDYHNYMNQNTYCECYYNRKHRKINNLKHSEK